MTALSQFVGKYNCRHTAHIQMERVEYFAGRMEQLGYGSKRAGILLINVDSRYGKILADRLMPDHDWQVYRDRKETPFARGLVFLEGFIDNLAVIDIDASAKLRELDDTAVIVFDHDVVEVFGLADLQATNPFS